jgi:hypothetical protein
LPGSKPFFSQADVGGLKLWDLMDTAPKGPPIGLQELTRILDFVHIEASLLRPYGQDYPLVEPRELVPSFDAPYIEYQNLPAFSMLVLDREISYQDEGFQFDILYPEGSPADPSTAAANRQTLRARLPRDRVPRLEKDLGRKAMTAFSRYTTLLPYLASMDRGHLISRGPRGHFHLAGVYASFPSDLDGEIKRFGRLIGKFVKGDNQSYAANRQFVYRFLMEQSGFPISGERHTSAALFARRLMRRRERFVVKVLGHSDRTITTLTSQGGGDGLPRVEKAALVAARGCSREARRRLQEGEFYVDSQRRVVILKVHYLQHSYHPDNVLEERALSVARQEVIHPQTGETLEVDVLGLGRDRLLMLNDIVRGEHRGAILYRDRERVVGTGEIRSRLKFLAAWLRKHRSLVADYSPDTFDRVRRIVTSFLQDEKLAKEFRRHPKLHQEVKTTLTELRLAHRLRLLEKLVQTRTDASGRKLQHVHILVILVHVLSQEGEQLAGNHPGPLRKLLSICRKQLSNPYVKRRYLRRQPKTSLEREVVGHHRLLQSLVERYQQRLGVDGSASGG